MSNFRTTVIRTIAVLVVVFGVAVGAPAAHAASVDRPPLLPFPADKPTYCVPALTKAACRAHDALVYLSDRILDPATREDATVAVLSPGSSWYGNIRSDIHVGLTKGLAERRCVMTHALNAAVEVYRKERQLRCTPC